MKNILCVDDVKTNLFTLEAIFETYAEDKYKILTATSGQEALDILLTHKIDLILLDVMMPEIDGFETAEFILKNKKTKDIPIVFLTAKQDDETIFRCYEVGGVDYMSKPFNAKELMMRVEFHLELLENKKILDAEKQLLQDIMDIQDNLVFVSTGKEVEKINEATKRYFAVENVEEFSKSYGCICQTLIKEEGYFHLDLIDEGESWTDTAIKRLKDSNLVVLIKDIKTDLLKSFDIKVKKFKSNYVITLTDITFLDLKNRDYQYKAYYDELTGVYNRNRLKELFIYQIQNESIAQKSFAFVMMDIDNFKQVNDKYGHLVGDSVLIELSKLISENIRESDIFARWGGEEFILILSKVDEVSAERIINTLRMKIENKIFEEVNHITCSFGVTTYKEGDSLDSIILRSDKVLYKAKELGRNRVCIH